MPECMHCGLEAGFLRSVHANCQQRVSAGKVAITNLVRFSGLKPDKAKTSAEVRRLAESYFLSRAMVDDSVLTALKLIVRDIQAKRLFEDRDVGAIEAIALYLGFPKSFVHVLGLPEALRRANELRSLRSGHHLVVTDTRGIVVGRNQQALKVFDGVDYQEDVKKRVSVRQSSGASVRVGRGLWINQSRSRGETQESIVRVHRDCGSLLFTHGGLYFRGSQHAFKIDCKQIVCLQHLAGGIGVMKHAANAQWKFFLSNDDSSATMNELARMVTQRQPEHSVRSC